MKRGIFIVIEGTDGTGKATQAGLLVERLKSLGHPVDLVDFPRYGQPSAYFAEEYLNGGFGSLEEVTPRQSSLFYALDRYAAKKPIEAALAKGTIVIANRYTGSNMAHQGAKFASASERKAYFDWLYDLEFNILAIPQPGLNLVLHMPAREAQKLVDQKAKRDYIKTGSRDLHEQDLTHLQKAEQVYLEICRQFPGSFKPIECFQDGSVLSITEVSQLIWQTVEPIIN